MSKVVTRIPPSPTGHLHIGTARTALFNYLFAEHHKGQMIYRSEDTDKERSKPEFETEIIEGLQTLGITWSNETIYRQSERLDIYKKYIDQALKEGKFYLSKEPSKKNPEEEVEVVRLKNPNKEITFTDLIRGEITFDTTELGDIVVARAIDDPLYHLVVVIDDALMEVTHVLRGEDHISNTPRQILIQEALGFDRPEYAHLPLILASDKSKMSKRHGAVAVAEYLEEGFLPEAIVNYLALLGWNPGTDQEIFSMEELIEQFTLEGVQKGGAVFDRQKFLWLNKAHLEKKSDTEFLDMAKSALPKSLTSQESYSDERFMKLLPVLRERIHIKSEITESAEAGDYYFAFSSPEVSLEMLKWKNDSTAREALPRLEKLKELLNNTEFNSVNTIKEAVWNYAEEVGKGELLWPMRVALTGKERSPDPFTVAYVIGKNETLDRIENAVVKLQSAA